MTIASSERRSVLTSSTPCIRTAAEMLSSGLWGCSWARNHNRSWARDRGQRSDFALRGIACRTLKTLPCRAARYSGLRAISLRPAASSTAQAARPRTFFERAGLFSEVRPIGGVTGATQRLEHLFHLAYPRSSTDRFSCLL